MAAGEPGLDPLTTDPVLRGGHAARRRPAQSPVSDDDPTVKCAIPMVVIGIDAHKRTHTAVLIDGNGRQLAAKTCGSTSKDHLEPLRWVASKPFAC